ncbi:hypothetical protein F5887DRAFT_340308 [Amanita rubescens]|nr:hypothetical protein F5887DRAFT_340308 [Amanita rubescens]
MVRAGGRATNLLEQLRARKYPEAVYNRMSGIMVDHSSQYLQRRITTYTRVLYHKDYPHAFNTKTEHMATPGYNHNMHNKEHSAPPLHVTSYILSLLHYI